jgi:hypothetical protein
MLGVEIGRTVQVLSMSARPPQTVSNRHNAIIDYMVANPTARLKTVAAEFQITQSWLSVLIHSSAFKAKLQARQDLVFNEEVQATVEERLMGVASVATDRLLELVPKETEVKVIADTMDKTLKALGYGQKMVGTAVQQNNTLVLNGGSISPDGLRRAQKLVGAARNVLEVKPLDQPESVGSPDVPEVPAGGEGEVGALDSISALLSGTAFEASEVSEGPEVRGGSLVASAAKI